VGPKDGAWRLNSDSDLFFKCPVKDACIGGMKNGVGSCAKGYQGNLCVNC
jgi:hypothetical protein